MADNPLGGLGNLMGGGLGKALSGMMPEGEEKEMMKATSEVSDLKTQEKDLLAEIGKAAYEQNPDGWPQSEKIKLIRMNLADAEKSLNQVEQQQQQAQAAQAASDAATTCPSCGFKNPEGTKFCQECGAKLEAAAGPKFCSSCGAQLEPGTRFCGSCGAAQEG